MRYFRRTRGQMEHKIRPWSQKRAGTLAGAFDNFQIFPETRTLIYTTNAIENFNRQLRKTTKTKGIFVSNAMFWMKILCLDTMSITEKGSIPNPV